MFDFHSITFENFKSYVGKHEFVFPTEPGLYFLTGSNELEPRLGSNGAGKSTLLDAIYWCLYGKTLRGLKASDVVTWGEKSCSVTLHLSCANVTATIARTQNPNSLELDGRVVEQKDIEKYLGLTPDAFTYSVIMPQYNQSFFELTPTNKLALFSQILNLDNWLIHSKKAAELAADIEKDLAIQNAQLGGLKIAVEAASKEINVLLNCRDSFDSERKQEVNQLVSQMAQTTRHQVEATEERAAAFADLIKLTAVIKRLYADYEEQKAYKDVCVTNTNTFNKDFAVLSNKVETAFKNTEKLAKVGPECPTCLQKVTASHIKKEQTKAEAELKTLRAQWKHTESKWETAKSHLQEVTKDCESKYTKLIELQTKERKVNQQISYFDLEINTLNQKIDAINDKIAVTPSNPYVTLLADKEKRLTGYVTNRFKLNEEIEALNADHTAVSFWIAGFKRVRLHIIEENLRTLELEVNNSLTNLGLIGWAIEFDIERENKSGSVTKGFMVFVRAPGQFEPTRIEAWSGGESQRLQLACDLGMANLIMQQAGYTNTIEFYDEPSKHLSKAGLMDLAETLHQRAIDDNKRIFLVDHNMPEFGEFADVITIIKNEEGSIIQ